jgi:alpha-amylase/alpha-mannosidase (GH57 family)
MTRHVCIHGHFYQPPRENPWLEAIEIQDSAFPYHDWNERIEAECYGPNASARILDEAGRITRIANNYERMSFNFGPTLLSWLEEQAPDTYRRILEADRRSAKRFGGHGSALAQPYNHMILPLANDRDRGTQIVWGIRDFEHRFGRRPEGMWLPETAVDVSTLEGLAEAGLLFTILTPYQAARFRRIGDDAWTEVPESGIDPGRPYRIQLPSGRSLAIFFYDGPVSRAVAFERLLDSGDRFVQRILGTFPDEDGTDRLAHIATDGESYGHHHRHGEMALAYALQRFGEDGEVRLTNYGEHLETHPPEWEVEIVEDTSWSCAHGVGRWREDCGCHTGSHPDWKQAWRGPLRDALDWLRDEIAPAFVQVAGKTFRDPWEARDDYVGLILDRSFENVDRFLRSHGAGALDGEDRVRALELMELQRHAMLMYTSCGWFFDDISGIETVQVLRYAGRVLQLARRGLGIDLETGFLERLEAAPGNRPEQANGRVVYETTVARSRVDLHKVCAHCAVAALFDGDDAPADVYRYRVERGDCRTMEAGRARLRLGTARVIDNVTGEAAVFSTGALHLGDHNLLAGALEWPGEEAHAGMVDEIADPFSRADFPEVVRRIDHYFGEWTYTLKDLFRDDQRRILDRILASTVQDSVEVYRRLYRQNASLTRFLSDLEAPLPRPLQATVETVLNSELRDEFLADPPDPDRIRELLGEVRSYGVRLLPGFLGRAGQVWIDSLARAFHARPSDLDALARFADGVDLLDDLALEVDLKVPVNLYYGLLRRARRGELGPEQQGEDEARWIDLVTRIGTGLGFRVTPESWAPSAEAGGHRPEQVPPER